MIEKGRYSNLKPEDRICKLCNKNEVEDEFHFVMKCSFYKDLRSKLLNCLKEIYDMEDLSDTELFLLIMSVCEYDTIIPVISYVNSAFNRRILHSVDV
jgi:predicted house-cleaning noncanonical NTP pyrophosphatase (MazG superfamily)